MPENDSKQLALLNERIGCLERIQAAQHAELGKFYAGLKALQAGFDSLALAASAPKN